eukprot:SAG11_NODE_74_length_18043_cov_13.387818_16_plen_47_part_00
MNTYFDQCDIAGSGLRAGDSKQLQQLAICSGDTPTPTNINISTGTW